jgi:cephalosporin hydroxylase
METPFLENSLDMTLEQWIRYHQANLHFKQTYKGLRMIKNPFDLVIYEEILWEVKPTVIIEIGNAFGGFTLWLADRMKMMDVSTKIITIDLSPVADTHMLSNKQSLLSSLFSRKKNHQIISLVGDCNDQKIIQQVQSYISDSDRVLIIEDSSHTFDNTLAVLNNYNTFVTQDSYFIVEDGICDTMKWITPGPLRAVESWIPDHPEFSLDRTKERYVVTYNPKGYLKKGTIQSQVHILQETANQEEIQKLKDRMNITSITY